MIYTLIQKIVLYDDRIEIFYNYIDPIKPDGSSADDDHRLFFIWDNSNILQPVSPTQKQHLQSGAVFVLALFQSVEPLGSREAFTPKPNRGDPFRGVG